MQRDTMTYGISLSLHAMVLATAIACVGVSSTPVKPILIDFTCVSGETARTEADSPRAGGASPPPPAQPPQKTGAAARAVTPASAPAQSSLPVTALEQSTDAAPLAATASAQLVPQPATPAHNRTAAISGHGGSGAAGDSNGPAAGKGEAADGQGGRGPSEETLRQRYLKKHFTYIRDLVASNLRYPGMARRMGWSGRLAVEFVVGTDGSAETIRVVKSSGVPLLDSDARDTVVRSAPFPKPPVSARLVIPVEYHLEN